MRPDRRVPSYEVDLKLGSRIELISLPLVPSRCSLVSRYQGGQKGASADPHGLREIGMLHLRSFRETGFCFLST